MSAKLCRKVFESDLAPGVKTTAAVLALFADESGGNIFPSLARVAWLVGKGARQVRADVTALVDSGVLVALTSRRGGAGRTTRYQLIAEALPARPSWQSKHAKHGRGDPPSKPNNPDVHALVIHDEPGSGEQARRISGTETRTSSAAEPGRGDPPIVHDRLEEKKEIVQKEPPPSAVVAHSDQQKTHTTEEEAAWRLALDRTAAKLGIPRLEAREGFGLIPVRRAASTSIAELATDLRTAKTPEALGSKLRAIARRGSAKVGVSRKRATA